ncbi:MAG: dTDP-4-dehydrorhamnose 3,5-epimerase [Gammaproteobacteria bacterium]|nr:dTDP-4-dehydrorhamnose 3,5-epimerase [Gammaproteobacteria bacterium]
MIDEIVITDLKRIPIPDGDILHGMKKTDDGYSDFGEIYFSYILKDKIKAWKIHKKMILNLIVPSGSVRFNFIQLNSDRLIDKRMEITVSSENYCRITVPPNIIFGFKGIGEDASIVANIADITHSDDEVKKIDINEFEFK